MLQERLDGNFLSGINCCQESMKNSWSDVVFFYEMI